MRAAIIDAKIHESSFENTIGTDESRIRYGFHTALEWEIIEELTATATVRWEDYDAYGDETTWRFGSVYHIKKSDTTLCGYTIARLYGSYQVMENVKIHARLENALDANYQFWILRGKIHKSWCVLV